MTRTCIALLLAASLGTTIPSYVGLGFAHSFSGQGVAQAIALSLHKT